MTDCPDRWDVSVQPHPQSAIMQAMRLMWSRADRVDRARIHEQVQKLADPEGGSVIGRMEAVWAWVADEYREGLAALREFFPARVARLEAA